MSIQDWSESIVVAELQDDPAFTDDLDSLGDKLKAGAELDVVLDFSNVSYLNSSNVARLIELREIVILRNRRKMILCNVGTHVWGILLVSELHKVFEFADTVAMGLTAVQISSE
jgi:anti-anti-sigma regulatory factor